MQNFPTVSRDNLVLSCFNCYQDYYNPHFCETDNAPKRGRYFMTCESCGMRSFFDFLEAENGNVPQNA